jgi:hypothetical protein
MSSLVELMCANLAPEFGLLLLEVLILEATLMVQKDLHGGDTLSGEDQAHVKRQIKNVRIDCRPVHWPMASDSFFDETTKY